MLEATSTNQLLFLLTQMSTKKIQGIFFISFDERDALALNRVAFHRDLRITSKGVDDP